MDYKRLAILCLMHQFLVSSDNSSGSSVGLFTNLSVSESGIFDQHQGVANESSVVRAGSDDLSRVLSELSLDLDGAQAAPYVTHAEFARLERENSELRAIVASLVGRMDMLQQKFGEQEEINMKITEALVLAAEEIRALKARVSLFKIKM